MKVKEKPLNDATLLAMGLTSEELKLLQFCREEYFASPYNPTKMPITSWRGYSYVAQAGLWLFNSLMNVIGDVAPKYTQENSTYDVLGTASWADRAKTLSPLLNKRLENLLKAGAVQSITLEGYKCYAISHPLETATNFTKRVQKLVQINVESTRAHEGKVNLDKLMPAINKQINQSELITQIKTKILTQKKEVTASKRKIAPLVEEVGRLTQEGFLRLNESEVSQQKAAYEENLQDIIQQIDMVKEKETPFNSMLPKDSALLLKVLSSYQGHLIKAINFEAAKLDTIEKKVNKDPQILILEATLKQLNREYEQQVQNLNLLKGELTQIRASLKKPLISGAKELAYNHHAMEL